MQLFLFVVGGSLLLENLHVSAYQHFDWAYFGRKGPLSWSKTYPKCGGTRQSPINIIPSKAKYDPTLQPFAITLKSSLGKYTVKNFGLNTEIFFEGTIWEARIEGNPTSCYRLHQIHFHWGWEDSQGSEHTINRKPYPIEAHIVMWNCQLYKDASTATSGENGLAVLSILFEIDNSAPINPVMKSIVAALSKTGIKQCPCKTYEDIVKEEMAGFDINQLLPRNRNHFYRYQGSLTTPPCTENVMWTVFKEHVPITDAQIVIFRSLLNRQNDNGGVTSMYNNFRPVQPLNSDKVHNHKREVAASFNSTSIKT